MIKSISVLAAVVFSAMAMAAAPSPSAPLVPNPSVPGSSEGNENILPKAPGTREVIHQCKKAAWTASSPSAEQIIKAKELMSQAKSVFEQHKVAIDEAKQTLREAWKTYPISKEKVETAEKALYAELKPVKEAMLDAHIAALNLLSVDQRAAFDISFKSCLKEHNEEEESRE